MANNSTQVLDEFIKGSIEQTANPDMTNKLGCFGTIAFTDDRRCKECDDYDECKAIDKTSQYKVVEEEIREIAAYYKLEDELKAFGAFSTERKTEILEKEAPKKPRKKRTPKKAAPGSAKAGDIDWSKLSFTSKVLSFDFEAAIIDLIAQKPGHYKDAVEIVDKYNDHDVKTRASMYAFVGKVLNELMRQSILVWDQKNKAAGIQWSL